MKSLLKLKYPPAAQLPGARREEKIRPVPAARDFFSCWCSASSSTRSSATWRQVKEFPQVFKVFLAEKLLMMIYMTLFSMLLLSALLTALDVFFISRDLHFLFSTPLPVRSAFAWKMLETRRLQLGHGRFLLAAGALFLLPLFCPRAGPGPAGAAGLSALHRLRRSGRDRCSGWSSRPSFRCAACSRCSRCFPSS